MKRPRPRLSVFGCVAILILTLISVLPIFQSTPIALAAGTITGTVFNDYNANGAMDTTATIANSGSGTVGVAIDTGVANVTVTAYDTASAAQGTTTTAANGTYTLNATGTGPYRIEFTNLPAGYFPTGHGTNNGTTVQFVPDGNSSNVSLGIAIPADYCQNNPDLVTSCYTFGDQISGTFASNTVIRSFPYSAGSSNTASAPPWDTPTTHAIDIPASQVGPTWGLAYNRVAHLLYAAAFMKKHTGFGPNGTGAIYQINPATNTASLYADLNALFGVGTAGANVHNTADYARDNGNTAWDAIGKTSLGGMAASDDGTKLYAMNLTNRTLYELPLDATPTALNIRTSAVPLTPPSCAATNDVRPFAVQYYQGLVYVGIVCSAESSTTVDTFTDSNSNGSYTAGEPFVDNDANGVYNTGNASQLRAYIYTVNPSTLAFSAVPVFQTQLNYLRRCADNVGTGHPGCPSASWNPWVTTFTRNIFGPGTSLIYPQPMLTDISFDRGNLVLGLRDRAGDQSGNNALSNPSNSTLYYGVAIGDLIRACGSPTLGWVLESNARCGGTGSSTQNNGEGPGNGEYYSQDNFTYHDELGLGGVAQVPGFPDVASTTFDPFPTVTAGSDSVWDAGVRWYSDGTGARSKGYRIYNGTQLASSATFAKAGGLGDLIALCDSAPIELGNRVWRDDNANGIQDAGEPGIAGTTVRLYATDGTTVLSTAVTDANGNYYFSSATGTSTGSAKYGISGLTPNTSGYSVRLDNATDYAAAGALGNLALTTADVTANSQDQRDSDGMLVGGFARTPVTTGVAGSTDHSYDFGFVPPVSLGNRVWWDTDNDGVQDAGEQPIANVRLELFFDADNSGMIDPAEQTLIAVTTSDASGLYLFTERTDAAGNPLATPQLLQPGTYIVGIPNGAFAAGQPLVGAYSSGTIAGAGGVLSEAAPPDPDADASDTDDNGAKQASGFYSGGVLSPPITLTVGGEPTGETPDADTNPNGRPDANDNQTVDFGFYTLQLGSQVWRDADNSATINAADGATPGIANVRVRLFAANGTTEVPVGPDGILGTADDAAGGVLTDASGNYRFQGLAAGDYIVEIDTTSAALTDYASSTGAGQSATPNDNIDGDDNGTLIGATTVRSAAVTLTPGAAGNNVVTAASGSTYDPTLDFGFVYQKVDLGNFVWYDTNDNGTFDAGESSIGGVTVNLLDSGGGFLTTTTTDLNGRYLFTGLDAGDYIVEVTTPSGYVSSTDIASSADPNTDVDGDDNGVLVSPTTVRSATVTLTVAGEPITDGDTDPSTNLTIDFGFYRLAVGNQLWNDVNNNGVRDAGEPALSGVRVELYDVDHILIAVTTTDGSGNYLFDQQTDAAGVGTGAGLEANDYYVKIPQTQFDAGQPLAGYHSSTGNDTGDTIDDNDNGYPVLGDGVRTTTFTLTPGGEPSVTNANGTTSNPTIDLGFYTMSLGNFVWQDANNSGTIDAADGATPGMANVRVRLFAADGTTEIPVGPDGVLGTADDAPGGVLTNSSGHYLFAGLVEGDYIVELDAGNFATAGLYPGYTSSTGTIGSATGTYEPAPDPDLNTADSHDNGTNQAGGAIRSGVITIAAGGEPTSAVETGGNTLSDPAPDTDSNLTVDFGLFAPVSLGNRVWIDANNNGAFDVGESNVPDGVSVSLFYDANGDGTLTGGETTAIRTTTTSGGLYLFANLVPGNYMVELDAANFSGALVGYTSSTGAVGSASGPVEAAPDPDADQSDTDDNGTVNGTLGSGGTIRSALVTLTASGEPTGETPDNDPFTPNNGENLTVDFGVFQPARLGDRVWYDADHDGVQDAGETGVPGVTVTLYDAGNVFVANTTTDASGNYLFPNLVPGSYHVVFSSLPVGYVFTGQDSASATDATDSDADPIGGQTGSYTLAAGGSDLTVDAGIYNDTRASLGDVVWYDTNENGVQDMGELGVPGVTVTLYTSGGTPVGAPTTTAADGSYLFSNLLEGDYYVQFTPPAGYVFTGQDSAGATDANDSDADTTTHQTIPTHLDPGETDLTWDAGMFYSTVALGNRVWEDANNNGVYDAGEAGISGATVTLYLDANNNGVPDGAAIATTTTDANGFYLFNDLAPDTYIVEVTPPAGYISSSGTNGAATGPYEGAATPDPDNNTDADDNGTTSGGVVRSAPITLTRGGEPTGEPTALPNPDTVTPDINSNLAVDFGFYRPLSLGNLVWHDLNDNGLVDGGESGISGVTVNLYDAGNNLVATTTTDASGNYLFTNLASGDYIVEVTTPSGYLSSTDIGSSIDPNTNVDSDDNGVLISATTVRGAAVTLTVGGEPADDPGQPAGNANRNSTVDFGFYQPVSLGNLVWGDSDNNGVVNGSESGIDGATVNLYRDANGNAQIDAGELIASQTTSGGGLYLFANLRPGDYIVELPVGNFAAGGALEHYTSSTGGASEPATDPDNDTDNDDNGTAQAGGSVTSKPVTLVSSSEPDTAVDTDGTNGNLTVDFGFYPLASLGDYVWLDANKDGVQDVGESGVPGVTVQLYQPGTDGLAGTGDDVLVATTTTGAIGDYLFVDLVPGNYFVQFGLPTGYAHSPQDTTADMTDSDADVTTGRAAITTLTLGEYDPSWDAGIYFTASLGDRVWLDQNSNGVQDAGEPGIPGVTVTLYTGGGTQVGAPVTTDATGNYAFPNLPPGDYYVVFTPPAGYQLSPINQGADDSADSDADTTTGRTATTTIALGENDPTWDAGLYLPVSLGNLIWNDYNNNGVVDGGESGVDGVVVNLYRDANSNGQIDAGEFVATQTTSGGGLYLFDNLVPGSYLVQLDPSNFSGTGVLAGYHSSTGGISTNLSATGPYEPAPSPNNDINNDDSGSTVSGQGIISAPILLTSGGEPTTDGDGDANSNLTVDFGVFLPAGLGSIVWYDTDKDGVRDPGEPGVPGVIVTLYDGNGNPIATTTTDANGNFQFTDLPPGSYSVGFGNLPPGYTFTPQDQGGNDSNDSDADPTTGLSDLVTLVPGQNNATVNAGLVLNPTAIALASFTATREGDQIIVRWVTTAEINTWGFQLYRSADGKRASAVRVTPQLILGQGRGQGGASYSWIDTDIQEGVTYTYWLVETETGGATNEYGPATASMRPTEMTYRLFMPLAVR